MEKSVTGTYRGRADDNGERSTPKRDSKRADAGYPKNVNRFSPHQIEVEFYESSDESIYRDNWSRRLNYCFSAYQIDFVYNDSTFGSSVSRRYQRVAQ